MDDVGRSVGVEGVNFGAGMGFLTDRGAFIRVGRPEDGLGVTPRRVGVAIVKTCRQRFKFGRRRSPIREITWPWFS